MKSTQILNGFQIKGVNERYLESSFFDIFFLKYRYFRFHLCLKQDIIYRHIYNFEIIRVINNFLFLSLFSVFIPNYLNLCVISVCHQCIVLTVIQCIYWPVVQDEDVCNLQVSIKIIIFFPNISLFFLTSCNYLKPQKKIFFIKLCTLFSISKKEPSEKNHVFK